MKITRMVGLLAAMAAVAALFAMPALASASNWKMEGTELSSAATIPGSGTAKFSGSVGATECPVTGTLELGAHSSAGNVTAFAVPNVSSCVNSGALAGCTLTSVSVENLNWPLTDTGTLATVGGSGEVKITNHYSGFLCPATIVISSSPTGRMPTLTPDSTTAIHKLTLGGELNASVGEKVTITGEFTPTNASDSGTYGL